MLNGISFRKIKARSTKKIQNGELKQNFGENVHKI